MCGLIGLIDLVLSCLFCLSALHPKVSLYTFISHLKCNLCTSTRPFFHRNPSILVLTKSFIIIIIIQ